MNAGPDDIFEVAVEIADTEASAMPRPTGFRLGGRVVEVAELLDRWPGADHEYVKLRGADRSTYILRHDRQRDLWQLVLFQRAG